MDATESAMGAQIKKMDQFGKRYKKIDIDLKESIRNNQIYITDLNNLKNEFWNMKDLAISEFSLSSGKDFYQTYWEIELFTNLDSNGKKDVNDLRSQLVDINKLGQVGFKSVSDLGNVPQESKNTLLEINQQDIDQLPYLKRVLDILTKTSKIEGKNLGIGYMPRTYPIEIFVESIVNKEGQAQRWRENISKAEEFSGFDLSVLSDNISRAQNIITAWSGFSVVNEFIKIQTWAAGFKVDLIEMTRNGIFEIFKSIARNMGPNITRVFQGMGPAIGNTIRNIIPVILGSIGLIISAIATLPVWAWIAIALLLVGFGIYFREEIVHLWEWLCVETGELSGRISQAWSKMWADLSKGFTEWIASLKEEYPFITQLLGDMSQIGGNGTKMSFLVEAMKNKVGSFTNAESGNRLGQSFVGESANLNWGEGYGSNIGDYFFGSNTSLFGNPEGTQGMGRNYAPTAGLLEERFNTSIEQVQSGDITPPSTDERPIAMSVYLDGEQISSIVQRHFDFTRVREGIA